MYKHMFVVSHIESSCSGVRVFTSCETYNLRGIVAFVRTHAMPEVPRHAGRVHPKLGGESEEGGMGKDRLHKRFRFYERVSGRSLPVLAVMQHGQARLLSYGQTL